MPTDTTDTTDTRDPWQRFLETQAARTDLTPEMVTALVNIDIRYRDQDRLDRAQEVIDFAGREGVHIDADKVDLMVREQEWREQRAIAGDAASAARAKRSDWEWDQAFARQVGLDEEAVRQFTEQLSLSTRAQAAEEKKTQGSQALQYMNQMTQMQGPRNWLQYGAMQRAGDQTQFPVWQQRLAEGLGFPTFQAGRATPPVGQGWSNAPIGSGTSGTDTQAQLSQLMGQQEQGTVDANGQQLAPWQQNVMQQAMNYIQPSAITAEQWAGMTPTEQQMLAGQVETPAEMGGWGGNWDDYFKQMSSAWPTGQVTAKSQFSGW